jgi:hypothetical protein
VVGLYEQTGRRCDLAGARLALATTLHTAGACGDAVRQAGKAIAGWTAHHRLDRDATGTYLVQALHLLDRAAASKRPRAPLDRYRGLLPTPGGRAREQLILAGRCQLGLPEQIRDHQQVCAARLDVLHVLSDGRRPRCSSYTVVRRHFLAVLTGDPYYDEPRRPRARPVTTPAAAPRRSCSTPRPRCL